ncbi:hypothetical protein [Achromobacter dolens]|uniref:hypothetical protein n=1 Tax=Achromobacter dolens TaxID=1287738 RepID=UPI000A89615B|nr:hypothetical protein [Achromobacter dolens]
MTTNHTPGPVFISRDLVHELNEKHGWFKYGDAQSDVSNAFANEAISRYERIRSAAPELLAALEAWQAVCDRIVDQYDGVVAGVDFAALGRANRAAIAKAKGEQQ